MEDGELVARLGAGDGEAFDEAYRRHHAPLHRFVARMVARRDQIDDVLQETWIRLARHAARLRPDTRLGAWLFAVARNEVLARHRWRVLDADRMFALMTMPARTVETPLELAQASETERRVERALMRLPVKYREVLLLVAIEGLAPQEAAAVIGVSPEAARQRLARARAMMQTLIEDER